MIDRFGLSSIQIGASARRPVAAEIFCQSSARSAPVRIRCESTLASAHSMRWEKLEVAHLQREEQHRPIRRHGGVGHRPQGERGVVHQHVAGHEVVHIGNRQVVDLLDPVGLYGDDLVPAHATDATLTGAGSAGGVTQRSPQEGQIGPPHLDLVVQAGRVVVGAHRSSHRRRCTEAQQEVGQVPGDGLVGSADHQVGLLAAPHRAPQRPVQRDDPPAEARQGLAWQTEDRFGNPPRGAVSGEAVASAELCGTRPRRQPGRDRPRHRQLPAR